MSPTFSALKKRFLALSKIEKLFVVALILRTAVFIARSANVEAPGASAVSLLFIIAAILFVIRSFPRLIRKLLWRVRHRLICAWVLLGVVPLVLICTLVGEGLYILMGQV